MERNVVFHLAMPEKRYGTRTKSPPPRTVCVHLHGIRPCGIIIKGVGETLQLLPRVVTYVRFGKTGIGFLTCGNVISRMQTRFPGTVGADTESFSGKIEIQSCMRRTAMAVTAFAEIPHKHGYGVFSFAQVFYAKTVYIGIMRIRSALQLTFPYHYLSVYVKPVF